MTIKRTQGPNTVGGRRLCRQIDRDGPSLQGCCSARKRNGTRLSSSGPMCSYAVIHPSKEKQDDQHGETRGTGLARAAMRWPWPKEGDRCDRLVRIRTTGLCKAHHEQMKRRGEMKPVEVRVHSTGEQQCPGPGRDGSERCERRVDSPALAFAGLTTSNSGAEARSVPFVGSISEKAPVLPPCRRPRGRRLPVRPSDEEREPPAMHWILCSAH